MASDIEVKEFLYPHQKEALIKMRNGCILNGGVGSGKSRTALSYYFTKQGGSVDPFKPLPYNRNPKDLYIITTARKRDDFEWELELANFLMSTDKKRNLPYNNTIVVESWNNINKYAHIEGAFFIFDEQRVVGYGAWVKAFLEIAKHNEWILLSATPGDVWSDYIPVFVANGFYRNKTEFIREHVVYSRYTKYPSIDRYLNTGRLIRLRDRILIDMDFQRKTVPHHEDIYVNYDIRLYKDTIRTRTNPYEQGYIPCLKNDPDGLLIGRDIDISDVEPIMKGWCFEPQNGEYVKFANAPIEQAAGLCYALRRIVNSSEDRQLALLELFEKHPKMIIFYNFNYELDILRNLYYDEDVQIAEWNGSKHQPVPRGDKWVYLVQYTAGAEGWNCIKTDTIVFFSQSYSWKTTEQARGRIDRLNTPYTDLYYYYLKSKSGIDLAISKALNQKKKFNERKWTKWDQ